MEAPGRKFRQKILSNKKDGDSLIKAIKRLGKADDLKAEFVTVKGEKIIIFEIR